MNYGISSDGELVELGGLGVNPQGEIVEIVSGGWVSGPMLPPGFELEDIPGEGVRAQHRHVHGRLPRVRHHRRQGRQGLDGVHEGRAVTGSRPGHERNEPG